MKSLLLCLLSVLFSLGIKAQNINQSDWEEVFYNQLTQWNNTYKGFDIAQIKLKDKTTLQGLPVFTFEEKEKWNRVVKNAESLLYFNQDSSCFIDIFSDRWTLERAGNNYYGADRQYGSIYLGIGNQQRLYEIDYSNGVWTYEEVYWLDKNRVVLVGSQRKDKIFIPFIQMIDIAEGMKYDFSITNAIAYKKYVNSKCKIIIAKPKLEHQKSKSETEDLDDLLGQ